MKITALELNTPTAYISVIAMMVFSVVACLGAYFLLNKIPAKWLCDYDEEPGEELLGQRYSFKRSGIFTSALFAIISAVNFVTFGYSLYTVIAFLILFCLLLITLSDGKFTIIPDQFTIALAVLCLGLGVLDLNGASAFIGKWWHIPLGAVCGGGFLMLINLISLLVFKKLGMGFGDVKLLAAMGLLMGFPRIFLMIVTSLIAAFVYVIFLVIRKLVTKSEELGYFPFGPFICVGFAANLLFFSQIDKLVEMYLSLMGV